MNGRAHSVCSNNGLRLGVTRVLRARSNITHGCAQIAAALKGSKAIEALDMGGNNIAAGGIKVQVVLPCSIASQVVQRSILVALSSVWQQ